MNRWKVVAVGVCALLSGCATLVNPGKSRSVETGSGDTRVKVARLRLNHTGPVLDVYNGGTQLQIRDAANHDDHVTICRKYELAATDPPGMVTVSTSCMNSILWPYVELPKSGTHTLRLVRPDGEATVAVRTSTHWQWLYLNVVCLTFMPACWGVDIVAGSWSYYGSVDVANAFRSAGTRTASVSHD